MLDGTITDRVEAESLNFNQNYIDIYSGSWGPDDTGLIYEGPGRMASEAFHKGATTVSQTLNKMGLQCLFYSHEFLTTPWPTTCKLNREDALRNMDVKRNCCILVH